jgi:hypothetical protein
MTDMHTPTMSDARKPKQVRLYLTTDSETKLASLKDRLGDQMSEAQIASLLVTEGLKAIEANGYRMELPLRLSVATLAAPYVLNQAPPVVHPRR